MSLKIKHICVSYGPHAIISDLTETFPTGKVTAVIGCNGAGKSTLFRGMAG